MYELVKYVYIEREKSLIQLLYDDAIAKGVNWFDNIYGIRNEYDFSSVYEEFKQYCIISSFYTIESLMFSDRSISYKDLLRKYRDCGHNYINENESNLKSVDDIRNVWGKYKIFRNRLEEAINTHKSDADFNRIAQSSYLSITSYAISNNMIDFDPLEKVPLFLSDFTYNFINSYVKKNTDTYAYSVADTLVNNYNNDHPKVTRQHFIESIEQDSILLKPSIKTTQKDRIVYNYYAERAIHVNFIKHIMHIDLPTVKGRNIKKIYSHEELRDLKKFYKAVLYFPCSVMFDSLVSALEEYYKAYSIDFTVNFINSLNGEIASKSERFFELLCQVYGSIYKDNALEKLDNDLFDEILKMETSLLKRDYICMNFSDYDYDKQINDIILACTLFDDSLF